VLVARVVDDDVDDELHPARMQLRNEPVDVLDRPEERVDALVVADVIAVVRLRRGIERRHPDDVGPERLDVVKPVDEPRQIAETVTIAVRETPRIHLVDHAVAPPRLRHRHSLCG
jgi:hypothetical protein